MTKKVIAFQGTPGAYSDLACRTAKPGWQTLPCKTFAETIEAVHKGDAELAMLACENSLAGRVPDIHSLLPNSGLYIVGEHFQRVEHCLLGVPGARIEDVKRVHTHPVAMGQISTLLKTHNFTPVIEFDTAGAAELVALWKKPEEAAVASELAGQLNGLQILQRNVEDAKHNTTRFYIASRSEQRPSPGTPDNMTTVIFSVKNIPGALYKVLGGFATSGINMTRLESYMTGGSFAATRFLLDVEGHPEDAPLGKALAELDFFSENAKILGVYKQSPFRRQMSGRPPEEPSSGCADAIAG
ncbi:prephenate dehydratase [Acetobacter tropicalis]|uniref:prephenate dehydratase n=1 Tax=Acetobacter tropicalis TaxID=104102 RepID=A0A094YL51_9PROT|nr:prephenate dehydratase [Acetobacter tropicalis]KAA8389560.1 prephenate dehydratase [Acetobacter tropicalis]KAA8390519.1 prephenate dehydratase [Acetobacter tropicalis]KGB21359.1 Prephenate dehydratase [Acetobacter tropicalis]MBC9008515.1 prephenate dehydratase [Acetobacter tropicalis]MDO8170210.1 prephenate dehydratase [Acetobacter tropicalis]